MNDEEFIKICKESPSMREACQRLGYARTGFNCFKRKAVKLDCYETNQSGKGIPSPSRRTPLDKYYSGELRISSYKLKSILLREGVIDNICDDCGISSIWNGKELILHLDHIDGNSYNNKRDNLRMLCPNCHSQTSSYCGKNRTNMNLSDADYLENIPKYNNVGEMMKALNRRPQGHHYRKVAELMEKHNVAFKEGKLLETKIFKPKIKKEYKCGSCGNPITSDSKSGSCSTCIQLISRTIQRPPYEQLKKEIEETSYNAVGRKYGVSDNSIRKWIKYYEKYS